MNSVRFALKNPAATNIHTDEAYLTYCCNNTGVGRLILNAALWAAGGKTSGIRIAAADSLAASVVDSLAAYVSSSYSACRPGQLDGSPCRFPVAIADQHHELSCCNSDVTMLCVISHRTPPCLSMLPAASTRAQTTTPHSSMLLLWASFKPAQAAAMAGPRLGLHLPCINSNPPQMSTLQMDSLPMVAWILILARPMFGSLWVSDDSRVGDEKYSEGLVETLLTDSSIMQERVAASCLVGSCGQPPITAHIPSTRSLTRWALSLATGLTRSQL